MEYFWKPITDLSAEERSIDLSDVESLKEAWLEVRKRLSESSPNNLKEFHEKLERQWSIETGILERIYDLDRGTTKVLIERGFLAGYIERSSTDREPEELIGILRDHKAAIDLVHDCVANARPLSIGFIHELHSILTRHQDVVEGVDQFGHRVSMPLVRGTFKTAANNPTRPDNTVHEYCPPIHVPSEMENLIGWCNQSQDLNPILLAAWVHHRFTQIHPYQDGNGRIARTLANLILVKGSLFPVVVTRDHRAPYIEALEKADISTIKPLARLFAEIEKKTILEALSISPDAQPSTRVVEGVVDAIASKLRRRKEEARESLRRVNDVAEMLRADVGQYLRATGNSVRTRLSSNVGLNVNVLVGGPDRQINGQPTAHWYRHQVATTAHQANQRVNFDENHYFVRLKLQAPDAPRLDFIVSLHHSGQELSGVMEVTAFAEISYPQSNQGTARTDFVHCMDKPFTITYLDNAEALKSKLLDWINLPFAVAIKKWGDEL